jgi:BlaI family transcriptional regulator, penicillinase repressor
MARPARNRPTDGELEILKVLWERGPSTVREVREALRPRRRVGHTTVLSLLQTMLEKGYLDVDTTPHAHIYRARARKPHVALRYARDLLDRVFDGSAPQLVHYALQGRKASPEEIEEVRRIIDEVERRSR